MRTTTRRTHAPLLALAGVALALGLAGCSGGGDADGGAESSSAVAGDAPAADRLAAEPAPNGDLDFSSSGGGGAKAEPAVDASEVERAVIRKGDVELRAEDVGKAQFDVGKVVT